MTEPATDRRGIRPGRGRTEGERRRRRLTAAGVATIIAILACIPFEQLAFGANPSISLSPDHGRGGTVVSVSAANWPPSVAGRTVLIYWDPTTSSPGIRIDSGGTSVQRDGTFNATSVTIPRGQGHFGANTVHACVMAISSGPPVCASGTPAPPTADATFTVPRPRMTLNRTSGRPGMEVVASGTDFFPTSPMQILWDATGTQQNVYAGGTDAAGGFKAQWTVPNASPGKYTVRGCTARGTACVANDISNAAFTITSPSLSVSPGHGLHGSHVSVSGQNYYPNCTVDFYFGPASDPTQVRLLPGIAKHTNGKGAFSAGFNAPTLPPGNYLVTAQTVRGPGDSTCLAVDSLQRQFALDVPPTPTPTPTPQPTPRPTPRPTQQPQATSTPRPTQQPTPQPTQPPSSTPAPTLPPSPTPIASPILGASGGPLTTPEPTIHPTTAPTLALAPSPTAPPVPTAAPTPSPSAAPVIAAPPPAAGSGGWPDSVPGSGQLPTDPLPIAGGFLLALLIAFLVPFPGTLFNKTVESNQDEIQGWFRSLSARWHALVGLVAVGPLKRVTAGLGRSLGGGLPGVWAFLVLSAVVYGFLNPKFGLDSQSASMFLGVLIGLGFITAAFDLPLRIYHRRHTGEVGRLKALWWTLAVAVVCVVVSRAAGFQPGYLYGLVVTIVFTTVVATREEGIGVWLASAWLLVLSVVAWILLNVERSAGGDPFFAQLVQTILATFVVAGIEALAIGLLPMRFLPGHPLFEWNRKAWFPLFALSIFAYLMILVDPANGYLSSTSTAPMIIGIVFLVAFGVVSIGTWLFFRLRPEREGADRPGEEDESESGGDGSGDESGGGGAGGGGSAPGGPGSGGGHPQVLPAPMPQS